MTTKAKCIVKSLSILLLSSLLIAAQFSAPSNAPIVCSDHCYYPTVTNGHTAVIVAQTFGQSITVYGGNVFSETISPDLIGTYTKNSIYHVSFTSLPYPTSMNVTLPQGSKTAILLLYEGVWQFDQSSVGDYANQNSAFPDCENGANCPWFWTPPIHPDKGDLLIAFGDSAASGCGAFTAGPGWTMEAVSCTLAVEDKIATVEAPDGSSMYGRLADGSDSQGSHWLMGLASYRRMQ